MNRMTVSFERFSLTSAVAKAMADRPALSRWKRENCPPMIRYGDRSHCRIIREPAAQPEIS